MHCRSYAVFCGVFFFSSRRRHTRLSGDWSSDVCSSDLINPDLADFLRERFPGVAVACADARHLDVLAGEYGLLAGGKPGAVVSGLGMLSMSSALRCEILRAAFAALGEGGRFIQFTYGPVSPVRRREREALGLRVRRAGFAP